MKLRIGDYEVEVKAKNAYSKRFNKKDTMAVLNLLAIYAAEASNRYEVINMNALQRMAKEVHNNIFQKLDSMGYYN